MPQLEEIKKLESEFGFRFFLIDSKGMIGKTKEILEEKRTTIPLLIDSSFYSRNVLKTMYTPTTLIIDGEGRLRARLVGGSHHMGEILTGLIESID